MKRVALKLCIVLLVAAAAGVLLFQNLTLEQPPKAAGTKVQDKVAGITPELPVDSADNGQPAGPGQPLPPPTADAAMTQPAPEPITIVQPMSGALERVTKKPFGIKVSPGDSPVNPERFSGYHTGVDLETTAEEQSTGVPVSAICAGQVAAEQFVSGYGGVVVQRCAIDGAEVTVLYGHLRLASVSARVGQSLQPGDRLGVLGTGFSKETDGERKHLHLGIHRGTEINYRGYVPGIDDLRDWIDPTTLLQQE